MILYDIERGGAAYVTALFVFDCVLRVRRRSQVTATAEVSRKMEGNTKLRRFPQGRAVDEVVLVGGATRMPCVQVQNSDRSHD